VLGRLDVDSAQRLAVQGVFAWVLLRHTAARRTVSARAAKPQLADLLDSRTLRRYLRMLAGVLEPGATRPGGRRDPSGRSCATRSATASAAGEDVHELVAGATGRAGRKATSRTRAA
jgi:hypothetical protein